MSRRPSPDAMITAAEWLTAYEGDDAESLADVKAVADWLREQASAAALRQAAREAGFRVPAVRAALKKRAALTRP